MRFKAVLERAGNGLGWTTVRVPFNPQETWTQMRRLRVRAKVLGRKAPAVEFRTSLFPVPGENGHYVLLVNKRVQREAGIALGSFAEFSLEADLAVFIERPRNPALVASKIMSLKTNITNNQFFTLWMTGWFVYYYLIISKHM